MKCKKPTTKVDTIQAKGARDREEHLSRNSSNRFLVEINNPNPIDKIAVLIAPIAIYKYTIFVLASR